MCSDTTTSKTLAILFSRFCSESGPPSTLVSYGGPQFKANEFEDKMKLWGIKHIFSPPYHPASNGQAERAVQIYKDRLKKMDVSARPIELFMALAYIGKVYGLTPHSSTDRCPYDLIKLSPTPSLFPRLSADLTKKSELTVTRHCTGNLRNRKFFDEGDHVVVYDNHAKLSYPAVVSEILGVNNYLVLSDNGLKHVSGDCLSRDVQAPAAGASNNVDRNNTMTNNDPTNDDDDVQSVLSDSSEDLDLVRRSPGSLGDNMFVDNLNNQPRHGRREIRNLGPLQPSRLRSGKV